jgi:hypothetical protein
VSEPAPLSRKCGGVRRHRSRPETAQRALLQSEAPLIAGRSHLVGRKKTSSDDLKANACGRGGPAVPSFAVDSPAFSDTSRRRSPLPAEAAPTPDVSRHIEVVLRGPVHSIPVATIGALPHPIVVESVQSGHLRSPGVYARGFRFVDIARSCRGECQSTPSGSSESPQSVPAPPLRALTLRAPRPGHRAIAPQSEELS